MNNAPLLPPITSFDAFHPSSHHQKHHSPSVNLQSVPYNTPNFISQRISFANVCVAEAVATTFVPVVPKVQPSLQKDPSKRPAPSSTLEEEIRKRIRTSVAIPPNNYGNIRTLSSKATMKKYERSIYQ